MAIQYLTYQQIDKNKWDHCVEKAQNHLTYAYTWYLDIICDQWAGLVEDDYHAVMPLCFNKKLLGYKQLYQPAFNQQAGVFSLSPLSEEKIKSFILAIPDEYKYLNISLNEGNPIRPFSSFTIYRKTNLVTHLSKPYEKLTNQYSDNHKRNVTKSKRKNLRLEKSGTVQEVLKIYRAAQEKKAGLINKDYQRIEKLMQRLIEKKLGFIRSIYIDQEQVKKIKQCTIALTTYFKNLPGQIHSLILKDLRSRV